ncbi:hypothetical protein CH373_12810 [Leptospira perolatii]|uniref:SHOCT domain-containing protein n=1 Tax=Leptospira perolatii TaxID=2023191 RepID=A0A2M9ZKZ6_9LEPT|nr:hypothetical protein CH360_08875 [Leptospira perolatii]PJZ72727.1 hypothetical protein CH373_12810 [Leptospira perolatii]
MKVRKTKSDRFTLLLIFVLYIFINCSGTQIKSIASTSESVAVFYINRISEEPRFLDPPNWRPVAGTLLTGANFDSDKKEEFKARIGSLFKYIGVVDSTVTSRDPVRIVNEVEAEILSNLLFEAENGIPDGAPKAYLILMKKEDQIRPGLRIRRTSFYLRNTPECIYLEFVEIGQVIDFQVPYGFRDWTLFAVSESNTGSQNEVFLSEIRPSGIEYVSKPNLAGAISEEKNKVCVRQQFWSSPKNESLPTKKVDKNLESRLKALKDLLEKGLITKQDYERKKAELLKEL